MRKQQSGFTLVELIVVILVLGILAATALPKFISVSAEARAATLNGMAGALRSAVSLIQAKYYAGGNPSATSVTMQDGTVVTVAASTGIPAGTQAGIGSVLQSTEGFVISYASATAVTFRPSSGGGTTCQVTYNGSTGVVAPPVISGC